VEWIVRSERSLYSDRWLDLRLADVELPDGRHLDHRLIRMAPSAGALVVDDRDRVLLLWRHRFITGRWGWEMPMGGIAEGETPMQAAAREVEEETGWRPGPLRPLTYLQPTSGIMDAAHNVFTTDQATKVSDPSDGFESSRIAWIPLEDTPQLIDKQELVSSSTAAGMLYLLCEKRTR
jgi:8-oxo-dGTP pyrophosphatase MutT (NUDIX family)